MESSCAAHGYPGVTARTAVLPTFVDNRSMVWYVTLLLGLLEDSYKILCSGISGLDFRWK